ncbi:MAG: hypothetical protein OXC44_01660, partial [Proteobacteria bacterium]|nr:hypothetical protein [Pseudomonadota bacterium]
MKKTISSEYTLSKNTLPKHVRAICTSYLYELSVIAVCKKARYVIALLEIALLEIALLEIALLEIALLEIALLEIALLEIALLEI